MSPRVSPNRRPSSRLKLDQLVSVTGDRLRTERTRRGWTLEEVARRAGVSRSAVQVAETGTHASLEMIVALSSALGLTVELELFDRRRSGRLGAGRLEDPVHAAMGELEAGHLRQLGFHVAIDEPYQHYQFAGRADLLAWDEERDHLLHLENRTRFPNLQEAAGSFNAKRAYLADAIAERLGIARFRSVTHVMVCLWSAEVLHALRMHPETFRSIGSDGPDALLGWWAGATPARGVTASVVLLDPLARGRRRQLIGLEAGLGGARPRVRGYAEAVQLLRSSRD